jgi:hypothetical protein
MFFKVTLRDKGDLPVNCDASGSVDEMKQPQDVKECEC